MDAREAQKALEQDGEARRTSFLQELEMTIEALKKKWNVEVDFTLTYRRNTWVPAIDAIPLIPQLEQTIDPPENGTS